MSGRYVSPAENSKDQFRAQSSCYIWEPFLRDEPFCKTCELAVTWLVQAAVKILGPDNMHQNHFGGRGRRTHGDSHQRVVSKWFSHYLDYYQVA